MNGLVPHRQRTANAYNIGVVYGQRSQLWWDLPLSDSLETLAAMYRIPKRRYRETLGFLDELLDLEELLDIPSRKLSLGQRMKGDLAAVLLYEPPILFLDEPTIGLDVTAKNTVLDLLETLSTERQTTILFTSHNLSDVERLCKRIIILDRGKVILDAAREAILARFGQQRRLVVEFQDAVGQIDPPHGEIVQQEAHKVWIAFNRNEVSAFFIDYLIALSAFWLTDVGGFHWSKGSIIAILGGTFLPLWVYPPAVAQVLHWLPFRGIGYTPVAVFIGEIGAGSPTLEAPGLQLAWVVVLGLLSRRVYTAGVGKVAVQGG